MPISLAEMLERYKDNPDVAEGMAEQAKRIAEQDRKRAERHAAEEKKDD